MDQIISDYLNFYYVSLALFTTFGIIGLIRFATAKRKSQNQSGKIVFKRLNEHFEKDIEKFQKSVAKNSTLSKASKKALKLAYKSDLKNEKKSQKSSTQTQEDNIKKLLKGGQTPDEVVKQAIKKVFVLTFNGDIMAKNVKYMRNEISLLLMIASKNDEVVIVLNSPGGAVSQYGLAGSQLVRIREAGIKLTVCVDVVAASGGYLMASVANQIIAAPFAVVGSVGVVAGVPNFNRLMKKNEIDYYLFTAGKYKRTVTPFAEVNKEAREKFKSTLEDVHLAFKDHIKTYRPELNVDEIATGEYWLASQALDKGLVDAIGISDDYIMEKKETAEVYSINTEVSQNLIERIMQMGLNGLKSRYGSLKNTISSGQNIPENLLNNNIIDKKQESELYF